jgi:two-component system NtrC family sensor kinase
MPKNSLKLRFSLYLVVVLSAAMLAFTLLILKHRQDDLQSVVARHVTQISEMVVASTRYTMLVNKRDIVEKIIEDIGKQKGIERIRVISKDGTIIHSNRKVEVGWSVEQKDGPCISCHQTSQALKQVPDDKRWKIVEMSDGRRVLGTMQAIRNEASCATASCHEHPANQSVLGIVDVAYSLDEMDQAMKTHALHVIGLSTGFILLFALTIGGLLQRLIYLPLKDLESGAERVSAGQLDHSIPVRSDDEFGRVAGSFNHMTSALWESRQQMQDLVQTLELKVTERTQELLAAKAEVAQGEKLASIGVLASGIAHELNNPLTGVLTFTSLLRKKAADGSEDAEDLDLVIRETKRCASIIKRLLDFAREKVPLHGFFNLNQVIEETVRFVARPASLQHIEIVMDFDPTLPQVWGDADLIKQVLLNLLVNAQQAINGKGSVTVQSRMRITAGDTLGLDPVPSVEIAVIDTGCGIAKANLERIFDPFFTTKTVGKGTGLGLSVSYGIVKAHGGRISVESVVGVGTTFRVRLPVAPPLNEADVQPAESTP